MPEDEAQPLGDVLAQGGFRPGIRAALGPLDGPQEERGEHIAGRVGDDGQGGPEHLDETAADPGTCDLGRRTDGLQRSVARDQLVLGQQLGQEALVGDVEEDGRHAGDQGDDVQLHHRQHTGDGGQRDARHRHRPHDIGADHQRQLAHPVDPGPGRQSDQQERGGFRGGEQPHLEGGGVELEHRDERQGDQGDLGTELSGRGTGEQEAEIAQTQRAAGRGSGYDGHVVDHRGTDDHGSKPDAHFRPVFFTIYAPEPKILRQILSTTG